MSHCQRNSQYSATKPKHPYVTKLNFKCPACRALLSTTSLILHNISGNNPSGDSQNNLIRWSP